MTENEKRIRDNILLHFESQEAKIIPILSGFVFEKKPVTINNVEAMTKYLIYLYLKKINHIIFYLMTKDND